MRRRQGSSLIHVLICAAILFQLASFGVANAQEARSQSASSSVDLQKMVDRSVKGVLERFVDKGLKEQNIAITILDVTDPQNIQRASYRGGEPIYPASVVKLFYLAAAHQWIETSKLKESEELTRALRDMIVESSNDATHYVLDSLTGVSNGAELSMDEMKKWTERRNAVNRYFASLGYNVGTGGINVNQKPWCEGPYGRERVFLGPKFENRNKLTTDATARLLGEIATGKAVNRERSAKMLELMKRDFSGKSDDPDDQAHGFTGIALSPGIRYWSKAGWTSTTRHDAAYLELPDGRRYVSVIFTTNVAKEREIIPTVVRELIK